MPKSCTNCHALHFGMCRSQDSHCDSCGGIGHLRAYCPNRNGYIKPVRGEPLAGTAAWIERWELNKNKRIKDQVLKALKRSPDGAINVNGVCIYRGVSSSFETDIWERGRDKSPERRRGRSRSPQIDNQRQRYRSRSPAYRATSPQRETRRGRYRSRSPEYRPSHPRGDSRRRRYRSRSPVRRPSPPLTYKQGSATLLRYEPDEDSAIPQYGLGDPEPSPIAPYDDPAIGMQSSDYRVPSRRNIFGDEVDAFGAPKFPREPEPRSTVYGRDLAGEIIRKDGTVHPPRTKKPMGTYVAVPDFRTVNFSASVLEAIDRSTRTTAKKAKDNENVPPANWGPSVRFEMSKPTPVVTSVPAAFDPPPKKVVATVDELGDFPPRNDTNTPPHSRPVQREMQDPHQTSPVQYEEDLICLSSPPRRMNQNAGNAEQSVFIQRAHPAQFMQPAQSVQPAPRAQSRESERARFYSALGLRVGANREQIVDAYHRALRMVEIDREASRQHHERNRIRFNGTVYNQRADMVNEAYSQLIWNRY